MAYLTSQDQVVNTFTIGQVKINLDEAALDDTGAPDPDADRVKENSYKLLPGHTYSKDPMVTVLEGSEESYVKMTVTFSHADELDAIFAPNGAALTSIFNGYDAANWIAKGNTKDANNNTRTYEFWYKEAVSAPSVDVELDALFDSITVPGEITNEQLATIEGMTITVNAYAIQADGFADADAAWAAFGA
jgi:methionine aminopeptidase